MNERIEKTKEEYKEIATVILERLPPTTEEVLELLTGRIITQAASLCQTVRAAEGEVTRLDILRAFDENGDLDLGGAGLSIALKFGWLDSIPCGCGQARCNNQIIRLSSKGREVAVIYVGQMKG